MTTPSKNDNFTYAGVRTAVVQPPVGPPNTSTQVIVSGRKSAIRPASKNNRKREDGTRQPSSWSASYGLSIAPKGMLQLREPNGTVRTYTGVVVPATNINSSPAVPAAEARAVVYRKALGNYGDAHQKLGVALREARGTAGLAAQYYKQSASVLHRVYEGAARDKGFRTAMRQFKHGWKEAPSRYLEYSYAIRPIAEDLQSAVDVLYSLRDRGMAYKLTLRGKHQFTDVRTLPVQSPSTRFTVKMDADVTTDARCSLVFKLPPWHNETLPPVTAFSEQWAVTGYSYIVDWALPITSWLRGFEGTQLRPFFSEGSFTMFTRVRGRSVWTRAQDRYVVSPNELPATLECCSLQRTVLGAFPTEDLFRPPRFRSILRLSHLDDAAALAGQRLAKLSRLLR